MSLEQRLALDKQLPLYKTNTWQLDLLQFMPIGHNEQIKDAIQLASVPGDGEIEDTPAIKNPERKKEKTKEELQKELKFAFENQDGYVARQYKFDPEDKTQKEVQDKSYEQLKLTVKDLCKRDNKAEVIRYLIVKLVSDRLAVRNTAQTLLLDLRRNGIDIGVLFDEIKGLLERNDNTHALYSREDFSALKDGKPELLKRIDDIAKAPFYVIEKMIDDNPDSGLPDPNEGD